MADSLSSIIQSLPNGSIVVLLITQWHKPAQDFALPQMANVLSAIGASAAVFGLDSLQKAIIIGAKGAPAGSALEVITADTLVAEAIKDYTIGADRVDGFAADCGAGGMGGVSSG